jgi:hypothetical protein
MSFRYVGPTICGSNDVSDNSVFLAAIDTPCSHFEMSNHSPPLAGIQVLSEWVPAKKHTGMTYGLGTTGGPTLR